MSFIRLSQKIEWCLAAPVIASWAQNGIEHGFSGKKYQPPPLEDVHYLKQVHGVLLRKASKRTAPHALPERIEGDAVYTDVPGLAVAVKTADCLPILFYHKDLVMAVHAGWRSAASGIVQKALAHYQKSGIAQGSIRMALGPCIGPHAFEVGPEVIHQFCRPACGLSATDLAYCLTKGSLDRWYVDLAVYAVLIALARGVSPVRISVMRSCTMAHPELWHSYRVTGARAGRNWAWVAL